MFTMLTASTEEIDDIDAAVSEIHHQLSLDDHLLSHSVGLITCHPDFIESGVVRTLCDSLPFDVVGCTTLGSATGASAALMQLTLVVLTGDDIRYATGASRPLNAQNLDACLTEAYAAAALPKETPALVVAFIPLLQTIAGEQIWERLNAAVGDIPIFGTLACDDRADFATAQTIYNGEPSGNGLTFVLLYGDIHPRFYVTEIPQERTQRHKAIITESEGYLLQEVNNMPTEQYLQSLGLMSNYGKEGLRSVPFIIDYNDGSAPVARALLQLTEQGHAICCGFMPVNATLGIGSMTYQETLNTTEQTVRDALSGPDIHGLLMFSCMIRNYALGADIMAEFNRVRQVVGERIPYALSYSGGELCPVHTTDGGQVNRFHNFTFAICVF